MRRGALVLAAVVATLIGAAPAHAIQRNASALLMTYLNPVVRAIPGDSLLFKNLDPLGAHNIVSNTPGLFASPLVTRGQAALVAGVPALPQGNYQFHCSLHAWMKGVIVVRPLL